MSGAIVIFVLFAVVFLSAGYWAQRVLEKWVRPRPLRYAASFAIVHTLSILILVLDGTILAPDAFGWPDLFLMSVDFPVIFVYVELPLTYSPPLFVLYVLIAGGLQWLLLGAVHGTISGWLIRTKHPALTPEGPIT
jgi:hypothetical protein